MRDDSEKSKTPTVNLRENEGVFNRRWFQPKFQNKKDICWGNNPASKIFWYNIRYMQQIGWLNNVNHYCVNIEM